MCFWNMPMTWSWVSLMRFTDLNAMCLCLTCFIHLCFFAASRGYANFLYHLLRPQSLPHMVQYFCFKIVRVLLPITVNDFKQGNCLCYFNKTYFEATCVVYEKHVQTKYVLWMYLDFHRWRFFLCKVFN